MSTYEHHDLTCPRCGHVQTVPILKGIHISRLPDVRRAILDGSFQVFPCPSCGVQARVESATIYTDFPSGQYIALEPPWPLDWQGTLQRHQAIFDDCFTFAPEAARELSMGLRCRLVFGLAALREKILLWDAGLDDWLVEVLKAQYCEAKGLSPRERVLRVLSVLEGGHLLLGVIPAGRIPPLQERVMTEIPTDDLLECVTIPAAHYLTLQEQPRQQQRYAWLPRVWTVDLYLAATVQP